jgi:uncharacterized protein
MPNPLWNSDENRLRALWRIILHTLMFFLFTGIFSGLLFLIPLGIEAPIELDAADPAALLQQSPLLTVLTSAALLLGMLVSVWLAGRWLDKRRFKSFGFHFSRLWWMDLIFGLVLGAVLMLGIFLVQLWAGWVEVSETAAAPAGGFGAALGAALILYIGVGIQEELLSRGYHLRNLAEGFNHPRIGARTALLVGYLISSAVFGLLHLANPNSSLVSTLNLILAGLFLGFGYLLTGELGLPIGLHITWNFFQGNVFGFPVSGTDAGPTLIEIQQGGPDLWTGGAFGPEAGLLGILAIMIGSLLTVAWVRWTRGRAELQTHLAEYRPDETL